jgi:hypothetical protein
MAAAARAAPGHRREVRYGWLAAALALALGFIGLQAAEGGGGGGGGDRRQLAAAEGGGSDRRQLGAAEAAIGAAHEPAFSECAGLWLDMDSPDVVVGGRDSVTPWGTHNHFDGHHSFTGPSGPEDFEACMLQCYNRRTGPDDACLMFHYVNHPPWFPCGLPSAGLPGAMALAPGALDPDTVSVYVLGFCDCIGCCTSIAAPTNGHVGSCDDSGRLAYGEECEVMCDPGYQRTRGIARVSCDAPGAALRTGGEQAITCTPCRHESFAAGDGRPCAECTLPRPTTMVLPGVQSLIEPWKVETYNCTNTVADYGCDYPIWEEDARLLVGTLVDELCPAECGCVGPRHDGPLCLPRQYVAGVCAVNTDSILESCSLPCLPGHGETERCVTGGPREVGHDRACEPCNATGPAYHSVNSTWSPGGEDESCRMCTVCQPGEAEIAPCNASTDTICETCPPGRFNTDGRVCHDCTVCPPGEGETTHCTPSTNSVCEACVYTDVHDTGTWSAGDFLGTVCAACTLCPAGERVATNCTLTNDTVCTGCAHNDPRYEPFYSDLGSYTCSQCSERCERGMNEDVPCRYESNRQCSPCEQGAYAGGSSVRNVFTEVITEVTISREYRCFGDNTSVDLSAPNTTECFGWEQPNQTFVFTNRTETVITRVSAEYLVQQPEEGACTVLAPAGKFVECNGICIPRIHEEEHWNQVRGSYKFANHGCGQHVKVVDPRAFAGMHNGSYLRSDPWTSVVDLSTNRPTDASSSAQGMMPSYANDGVWAREHFNQGRHHSEPGVDEWWSVKLAAPTVDPQVDFYARSCCTEQFGHKLRVYIGETAEFSVASHCITWEDVVDRSKQTAICGGRGEYLFVAADGYLQIPEIVVYGVPLRDVTVDIDINATFSNSSDPGLLIVPFENFTDVVRSETTELLAGPQCQDWTRCSLLYEHEIVAPTETSDRVCAANTCDPGCDGNAMCTQTACSFETQLAESDDSCSVLAPSFVNCGGACVPGCGGVAVECDRCNVTAGQQVVATTAECRSDDLRFGLLDVTITGPHSGADVERTCICNDGFFGNGLQCLRYSDCLNGSTYEVAPPNATADRTCVPVSPCGQFQFELAPPTTIADRTCGSCPVGTYQPLLGQLSCPWCPAGRYDHDANPKSACELCREGYTVTEDRLACQGTALIGLSVAASLASLPDLGCDFDTGDELCTVVGMVHCGDVCVPPSTANGVRQFEHDLVADVAAALLVSVDRFKVLSVAAGSVVVYLEIIPGAGSDEPSPFDLLNSLQTQVDDDTLSNLGGFAVVQMDVTDDPCLTNPCDSNAACIRTGGENFRCECHGGLWGDGFNCIEWSSCTLNSTYEMVIPNATVDRQCVDVSQCPKGFVEQEGPTYSTDRICSPCPPGTEKPDIGQYVVDLIPLPEIINFTNITVNTTANASNITNMVYFVKDEPFADYESAFNKSLSFSNISYVRRITCDACPPGRYDHDRNSGTECASCRLGYTVGPERDNCTLHDPCLAGEHSCAGHASCMMTGHGLHECSCDDGFWGDGQWCEPHSQCIAGLSFETAEPTRTSDRFCSAATECLANEYEYTTATALLDRNCSACAPGNYVYGADCVPCSGNTYDHDLFSDTLCVECRHGTPSDDRMSCVYPACDVAVDDCAPQAICINLGGDSGGHLCECGTGFWGNGQWCTPWTQCTEGHSYETTTPTWARDRVCTAVTECAYREVEHAKPTVLADRVCGVCEPGYEKVLDEVSMLRYLLPLWQDVLGPLGGGQITPDSNFLDQGGNDVVAIQMLYTVKRDFGIPITLPVGEFLADPVLSTVIDLITQYSSHEIGRVVCNPCEDRHYDHDEDPNTPCILCGVGYQRNAQRTACELDDPCAAGVHDCAVQAQCTRTAKAHFACECTHGYFGDGKWCSPWTECVVGTSYEAQQPTSTRDRVCAAVTVCPAGATQVSPTACVPTVSPVCAVSTCTDRGWQESAYHEGVCMSGTQISAEVACDSNATFQDALRMCLDVGARLCALEEIAAGDIQACSHIVQGVWSSTTDGCPDGSANTLLSRGANILQNCTAKSSRAAVRCCANKDAEMGVDGYNCTDHSIANRLLDESASLCTYPTHVAMDRICRACPPGTFSERGSSPCVACAPGKYDHDSTPASHCEDCPVGYVVGDGNTTCTLDDVCTAGLHGCAPQATCERTGPGEWSCTCQPGHFGDGRCIDPAGAAVPGFSDNATCVDATHNSGYVWIEPVEGGCTDQDGNTVVPRISDLGSCLNATMRKGFYWQETPSSNVTVLTLGTGLVVELPPGTNLSAVIAPENVSYVYTPAVTACIDPEGAVLGIIREDMSVYADESSCVNASMHAGYEWLEPVTGGCYSYSSVNDTLVPTLVNDTLVPTLDRESCEGHTYPAEYAWMIPGSWCHPWTECEIGFSFETVYPNHTADRECQLVTVCARGEYETTAPANQSDRRCSACPVGSFSAQGALECEDCKAVGRLYHDHDENPATPCVMHNGLVYGWILMALIVAILGGAVAPLYKRPENRVWLKQKAQGCKIKCKILLLRYGCRLGKVAPDKYKVDKEEDDEYEYYSDEDAGQASLVTTSIAASKLLKNTRAKRMAAPQAVLELTGESPPTTPPVESGDSGDTMPGAISSPKEPAPWRGEGRVGPKEELPAVPEENSNEG